MPRPQPRLLTPCLSLRSTSNRFAANAAVAWNNATDVTFETWCQVDQWVVGVGQAYILMCSSNDPFAVNGGRAIYWLRSAADRMSLIAYAQGATPRSVSVDLPQLIANKIHVVATYSNTNGIKLYVNGVLVAGPSAACDSTLGSNYISLGNIVPALSAGWVGLMAGTRVWARALSASEVADAYAGRAVSSTNQLGDWPCTDGVGLSAADRSGNGNNLTLDSTGMWDQRGFSRPRLKSSLSSASDLPGLACDFDASKLALNNLDPVASFTDQSSNANHATAAGSARPTFKTNQRNGLAVVEYDGVANVSSIVGTSVGVLKDFTCFLVSNTIALGAASNEGGIFGNLIAGQMQVTHYQGDSAIYAYVGAGGNRTNFVRAPGTWTLASFTWDGATLDPYSIVLRTEGVNRGFTKSTLTPSNTSNYAIGRSVTSGNFWNGQIAQIVLYRRRLFDVEMKKVEEMLAEKWGF